MYRQDDLDYAPINDYTYVPVYQQTPSNYLPAATIGNDEFSEGMPNIYLPARENDKCSGTNENRKMWALGMCLMAAATAIITLAVKYG